MVECPNCKSFSCELKYMEAYYAYPDGQPSYNVPYYNCPKCGYISIK